MEAEMQILIEQGEAWMDHICEVLDQYGFNTEVMGVDEIEIHIPWITKIDELERKLKLAKGVKSELEKVNEIAIKSKDAALIERDSLKEMLEDICSIALIDGFPESTPNAAGTPVSTEPSPLKIVEYLLSKFNETKAENNLLTEYITSVNPASSWAAFEQFKKEQEGVE